MRGGAFLVFVTVATTPVAAQWRIGLEVMNSYHRGSAVDTSGNPHARPGDALTVGLRIEQGMNRLRAAVRLSYGKPGFSITGQGVTINDKTANKLFEAAASLGFRVGGIGPSGAIRAEVGPALHLWKVGDETRSRVGALAATIYEWPVTSRFTGALRLEGAVSKSWFDAADLPPEYRRQVTWRFGWGAGLRYRL